MNRVAKVDDRIGVKRVLVSVSDKSELETLVPRLARRDDVLIFSTGGTYDRISSILGDGAKRTLRRVSDYTGQPEMQGGLVKTLDYRIYLGLLSEPYNDAHAADRRRLRADLIDMVVVNLYPFRETASRPGSDAEDARSNIDIGGPCMLRAAAKSYLRVAPICDPSDYGPILDELDANDGSITLQTRFRLAQKAFEHTARYDRAIADYLAARGFEDAAAAYEVMP